MRFLSGSKTIARSDDWLELVTKADERYRPVITLKRTAPWWIADIARMGVSVDDLYQAAQEKACPVRDKEHPDDLLYELAADFWASCLKDFTPVGMIAAICKAAQESIKTPEELARLYAEDCGWEVEE
jgi:hypothetical protein